MRKQIVFEEVRTRHRYGVFHFLLDLTLTCITGGLWLIYIFVREMRGLR